MTPLNPATHSMRRRWRRLEITVRCALEADNPARLGQFIAAAARLVADGALPDWTTHERCFTVLMNTAEDAALPWHWRCMCIDFACRPLARLTTLARGDRVRHRRVLELARRLALADMSSGIPSTRARSTP
jgi:hypothetical protein